MRRALITGAEQGLGQAISHDLRMHLSVDVVNLRGAIIREGKAAIEAELASMDLSGCDLLINNFGINHLSWIGQTPDADEAILRVNVLGPYWIVNWLVANRLGPMTVVNIASQTYRIPQRTTALYCASKAALVQLTKVMARELAPAGWVINALAPGKIRDTEMSERTDAQVLGLRGWSEAEAEEYAVKLIPMERFTSRLEVAEAVRRLLAMPNYVNGTVLDMTGGV